MTVYRIREHRAKEASTGIFDKSRPCDQVAVTRSGENSNSSSTQRADGYGGPVTGKHYVIPSTHYKDMVCAKIWCMWGGVFREKID